MDGGIKDLIDIRKREIDYMNLMLWEAKIETTAYKPKLWK